MKINQKKQSIKLKLDFTTALVVGAVCIFFFSIFLSSVLFLKNRSRQQSDHTLPLEITNLPYCSGEKLDLFVPQNRNKKKLPLVIYIHGGGWQYGSKVGGTFNVVKKLTRYNFAVASINYRLSSKEFFPAQIQDVNCALRYLRAHAQQFGYDGTKIATVGISAGAHLSALAANSSSNKPFEGGANSSDSSKVQASVNINGLYNLSVTDSLSEASNVNIKKLLGGVTSEEAASPERYLSEDDAPQLLIYSTDDHLVDSNQTLNYAQKAKQKGVQIELLKVEHATHSLDPYLRLKTDPSSDELVAEIATFLNKKLR